LGPIYSGPTPSHAASASRARGSTPPRRTGGSRRCGSVGRMGPCASFRRISRRGSMRRARPGGRATRVPRRCGGCPRRH